LLQTLFEAGREMPDHASYSAIATAPRLGGDAVSGFLLFIKQFILNTTGARDHAFVRSMF